MRVDAGDYNLGHRRRLKEKFLSAGISAFLDHEVLELMLTYAVPRRDVKPLAKELLGTFGSLKGGSRCRDRRNIEGSWHWRPFRDSSETRQRAHDSLPQAKGKGKTAGHVYYRTPRFLQDGHGREEG